MIELSVCSNVWWPCQTNLCENHLVISFPTVDLLGLGLLPGLSLSEMALDFSRSLLHVFVGIQELISNFLILLSIPVILFPLLLLLHLGLALAILLWFPSTWSHLGPLVGTILALTIAQEPPKMPPKTHLVAITRPDPQNGSKMTSPTPQK